MPKFHERSSKGTKPVSISREALIAKRYVKKEKLGSGSFGTVFLVLDTKAKNGEELKVLKEIPVGDLNPNETVAASLEAQLLSKLDHPAIVKFHASFLEMESFCIITEYCEGRDLDCKIQEYKKAGKRFSEGQIVEWFVQLLLGVHYMHERRILHRDLKTSNIFLKNNLVKIGDFGVSRFLMGSCDLATTFTGTPYYMSPEALNHQGYDSKSDIWSLGCILYEMCCLEHAFSGYNFLTVVLKIVEGDTPALPGRYSSALSALMESMLSKDPCERPSAGDIIKNPFFEEQLQELKSKFSGQTLKEKSLKCQKDEIMSAVKKKLHLQTLREWSELQKMTPRERMRLRKLNAADEKAKKMKQLAEEKFQENQKRKEELKSRNLQLQTINILNVSQEPTPSYMTQTQPVSAQDYRSIGRHEPRACETPDRLCMSEPVGHEIPEDSHRAEEFYKDQSDDFESCSDVSEEELEEDEDQGEEVEEEDVEGEEEDEEGNTLTPEHTYKQDSDVEAMVMYMENVLGSTYLGSETVTETSPAKPRGAHTINDTMAWTKMKRMRESAIQNLGESVFDKVYKYLKKAREQSINEDDIKRYLEKEAGSLSDCFEVDQLLYFEEQFEASSRTLVGS
ncbi:serine/threonine-protein kinase Nek11 [Ambystoma mexicanum]|uniref:serine/threonine-protein kinase Nek11 n=1 Tax=Ambystoma mexicanum TaxID=8296 RepID=UPI0037E82321